MNIKKTVKILHSFSDRAMAVPKTKTKKRPSKLIRRVKAGARAYLLLTGIGTAACVLAPFAAAYQILKSAPDPAKQQHQKEFFRQINSSIDRASNHLQQTLKDFDPLNGFNPFDPFGNEPWKQKHHREHDMTDEEWEKKNESEN